MPEGGDDHGETGDHLAPDAQSLSEQHAGDAEPHHNGNGDDHHEDEQVESVGGADALEEAQETRTALPPQLQDPGSHQAPPGHARAGGQGRARLQRRGADDLPLARRPLFGADAQHRAWRRHQPQDHLGRRPLASERNRARARSAGRHGRDPAHRRCQPHQARGQARLRISAAAVGDGARPDAQIDGAEAGLRRRLADQALDPRFVFERHRRNHRLRRRGLQGSARIHAHADAQPRQEREVIQGYAAALQRATASRASSTPCSRRPFN